MFLNLLIVVLFIGFAIYSFYNSQLTPRQKNYNVIADLVFAGGVLLSLFSGIISLIGNGIVLITFVFSCYQWFKNRQ